MLIKKIQGPSLPRYSQLLWIPLMTASTSVQCNDQSQVAVNKRSTNRSFHRDFCETGPNDCLDSRDGHTVAARHRNGHRRRGVQ